MPESARAPTSVRAPSPATTTATRSSRTEIGEGAFIGSNTALVAPVTVGPGAVVGAGSVITEDVEADAIAVARGEQQQREGAAARRRERRKPDPAED